MSNARRKRRGMRWLRYVNRLEMSGDIKPRRLYGLYYVKPRITRAERAEFNRTLARRLSTMRNNEDVRRYLADIFIERSLTPLW
jgi:hypothetical protein